MTNLKRKHLPSCRDADLHISVYKGGILILYIKAVSIMKKFEQHSEIADIIYALSSLLFNISLIIAMLKF